jgi:hypothetical protein
MKSKMSFLVLVMIILCNTAIAQKDTSIKRFKTAGGITGFGKAVNTDTRYEVFYFAGDFSWSFRKIPKKKVFLSWYFEPQFNLVRTPRPLDIEFGANLGLRNYIRINNNFLLYQMLGSGPHFITAEVSRQANGFIFSDNLALGSFVRLSEKDLFLNLQFKIRHLSNAELKNPNAGINTWNVMVGLSKLRQPW